MEEPSRSRGEFLKSLLQEQFARQVITFETLGRDSNNYVFHVHLTPLSESNLIAPSRSEPGTTPLPRETTEAVLRISNPDAMLDNTVRSQNEVAAISLARNALASYVEKVIPDVYGWSSIDNTDGYSWILEEYRPGQPLDKAFSSLSSGDKQGILRQMAQIFKRIQDFSLPFTITGYGGLGYDDEGNIVSAPLTFGFGGPFSTYEELYKGIFAKQLELADSCSLVGGWKSSDLRGRLEKFLSTGISSIVAKVSIQRPTLIHGDLDLQNIVFDPATLRITGLLDFDFANIASPTDEYFYSFPFLHGILPSHMEVGDEGAIHNFLVTGKQPPSSSPEHSDVNWDLAKMWNDELARAKVLRPSDIEGIGELAGLYWFIQDICPPYFLMPRWIAKKSTEQIDSEKKRIEGALEKYLDFVGY